MADIVNFLKDKGLEYTWRGAIIGGDIDRINEFLENGQDIEERSGYFCEGNYQYTAVQMANKYGRTSIARYLLLGDALIALRDPADPLRGLEAKLLSCLEAQCLPGSENKLLEVENKLPGAPRC